MAAEPPMDEQGQDQSLFGYERVATAAKTARVKRVFDAVSPRYDLMNDLMSGGLHRLWKRFAVDLLKLRPGHVVLDLAGGTGDIARLLVRRHHPKDLEHFVYAHPLNVLQYQNWLVPIRGMRPESFWW